MRRECQYCVDAGYEFFANEFIDPSTPFCLTDRKHHNPHDCCPRFKMALHPVWEIKKKNENKSMDGGK